MIDTIKERANPQEKIGDSLQEEATVGYKPTIPLETLWMSGTDFPMITMRRDIEFMQMHPIVQTAIEYYRSGIAGAQFWGGPDEANPDNPAGKPVSTDPRVSQFVIAHAEKFWQSGVPLIQDGGYIYGWAPGEHIYKETNGLLVWSHLKSFHPNDGFILIHKYNPVGVRVKNIREKEPVDLWLASKHIPAKACWYAHRPKFNSLYGRSQLMAAWRPWRRLGWRDAVEQVIDAAIYRAGYKGPIVKHPPEDMQTSQQGVPATRTDGGGNPRRSARDVARQIVEWAKAGAGFTLSSAKYHQSQGGGDKWSIEWPEHVMDVRPLIEAARYLEDQVMLGIGVPPELVRSGGTGSGYSGRSIPREAFLGGQQLVANAMLQIFVEQVIQPLVLWNYGDIPFNIQCKSILQSQSEEKQPGQGQGFVDPKRSQAAKDAWQMRKVNQPGNPPNEAPSGGPNAGIPPQLAQLQSPAALSVIPTISDKVIDIMKRALKRKSA